MAYYEFMEYDYKIYIYFNYCTRFGTTDHKLFKINNPNIIFINNSEYYSIKGKFEYIDNGNPASTLSFRNIKKKIKNLDFSENKIKQVWYNISKNIFPTEIIQKYIPSDLQNTIGIHLRKTDKITTNSTGCTQTISEFNKIHDKYKKYMLSLIEEKKYKFFCCSEDIKWKNENIRFIKNLGGEVIECNNSISPSDLNHNGFRVLLDFFILSRCNCILQTVKFSSFSTIASLLNNTRIINFSDSDSGLIKKWKEILNIEFI